MLPILGAVGAIGSIVTDALKIDAERKTRNKTLDEAKKLREAQTDAAKQQLSLEERMVEVQEQAALSASQPTAQVDWMAYAPWLALGVGAWFLLRRK